VALRSGFTSNRKTFDFQRFANITQTLDLSTLLRITVAKIVPTD
jgi:hypothetical protein